MEAAEPERRHRVMSMSTSEPSPKRRRTALVAVTACVAVVLLVAGALFAAAPSHQPPPAAGPVEVGFTQDMVAHHAQGVEIAAVARDRASDPAVRQLAEDTETAQLEELGRMKGWLSLWNQPETSAGGHMAWMAPQPDHEHGQHAHGSGATMPGMASAADLGRLNSLQGAEFDTFFVQLMLRHHQGGAPMLTEVLQRSQVPQVRDFAQQVLREQGFEVVEMSRMLSERGATSLPL